MRKGIGEGYNATRKFTRMILEDLRKRGYRFVLVKGLTADNHYEHIEPSKFVLIPLRELPGDAAGKDIYEPIESTLLESWAAGDSGIAVFI